MQNLPVSVVYQTATTLAPPQQASHDAELISMWLHGRPESTCKPYDPDDSGDQLEDVIGKVIDGDTLYVGPTKIRLQGIAAPELDEPLGPEARDFLTAIALGNRARCDLTGEISFDRQVAVCRIDGKDLGRLIVEAGLARDCRRYSGGRYEAFEVERSKRLPLPGYCSKG